VKSYKKQYRSCIKKDGTHTHNTDTKVDNRHRYKYLTKYYANSASFNAAKQAQRTMAMYVTDVESIIMTVLESSFDSRVQCA